jgi:putative transposase
MMNVDFKTLAAALKISKRAVEMRSKRENWIFVEETGLGGKRKLFPVERLPKAVQNFLAAHAKVEAAVLNHGVYRDFKEKVAKEKEEKRLRGEQNLLTLMTPLASARQARFDGRLAIIQSWERFWHTQYPLKANGKRPGKKASMQSFAEAYAERNLKGYMAISDAVYAEFNAISQRTLMRWEVAYSENGQAGLIDHQDGEKQKAKGIFTRQPLLEQAVVSLLLAKPHISAIDLMEIVRQASVDKETGEVLFEVPKYDVTCRFMNQWKTKNAELFCAATNPDQWKNSFMVAYGDADEDVVRLNQRWEMDATPADWMLIDDFGTKKRYSASVVIDVFSRRALVVLSPTPRAETHALALRLAMLSWGVPEQVVTDNGKDYLAKNFLGALDLLGIDHFRTNPFSPWEKPFVERMNQTMLHSILEVYSSFIGHNVAERSAIEARQSFSQRLFDKEVKEIEMAMPAALLQERINLWLNGTYEQNTHEGIGMSPFARAASYQGEVRRIQNERALDVLLAPPAGKGTYTITKKGLTIQKAQFLAMELAVMTGKQVQVYLTDDYGQVVVYHEGKFVCVARCPERTGISRQEIAVAGRKKQRAFIADQKKSARSFKLDPDQLVSDILQDRALAAGKLAMLPKAVKAYSTTALSASADAAKTLDGAVAHTPIPADLQRLIDKRNADLDAPVVAQVPAPSNVKLIPDTPELRFRKWLGLDDIIQNGGTIDDPRIAKWHSSYTHTPEFPGQMRRWKESNGVNEKRNTAATVLRLNNGTTN